MEIMRKTVIKIIIYYYVGNKFQFNGEQKK